MAIIHSWICMAHGSFMGSVGKCPSGCGEGLVRKEYGAAVISDKTKFIDKTAKRMASEYGLTDMNNRGGQPIVEETQRWESQTIEQKRLSGQTYSVSSKEAYSTSTYHSGDTDNVVQRMKNNGTLKYRTEIVGDDKVRINPKDIK